MDPRPSFAIVLADPEGVETHHVFTKSCVVIGRQAGNDLVLRDTTVSRKHCTLEWRGDVPELVVTDLGSGGGVLRNGKRVVESSPVHHGDKLLIGAVIVRIEIPG
jgi:pSer/pThr/pTyr-binding forkhead associated (FHA) protein